MAIALMKTQTSVETPRRQSGRVCRPWLAFVLVILVAMHLALVSGAWEYPYAKLLMPDVIRTQDGFVFPPQTTAHDAQDD